MSTPAPSRSSGALQAAQQQLDELDSLIQRMLTLPPNPGDTEASSAAPALPAPAAPAIAAPPPPPERPAAPLPPIAGEREEDVEPAPELLPPPLLDPLEVEFQPVPLGGEAEREDEVLTPAEPFQVEAPNFDHDAANEEEDADDRALTPALALSHPAGPRGPLVVVNQAFDRLTFPFGTVGYWLRSAVGRDVLGWTGVALIAGSAVWALLDWLGWTW